MTDLESPGVENGGSNRLTWFGSVETHVGRVSKGFSALAAVCSFAVIVLTTLDVSSRLLTNRPLPGVIEYIEVLLVAIIWLGMAYALRSGSHVSVRLFIDRVPRRAGAVAETIGLITMVAFLAWLSVLAIMQVESSVASGEYRWGLIQVPMWPARTALALGLLGLLVETVLRILRLWQTGLGDVDDKPGTPQSGITGV